MQRRRNRSRLGLVTAFLAIGFGAPCDASPPPKRTPTADAARPAASSKRSERPNERPNVVIILADDLGYGDAGCYGATKVKTPNIDRLAREGRLFTDAHSPSSVCTPSRYALLTGRYAWRHPPASGILQGNAPLSIPLDCLTLPRLFQSAGYATGAVGKWHLGLGKTEPDFNGELRPGPLEIGFDYFFGFAATGDRTPCVFIENHRVVGAQLNDPIRVSYESPLRDDPIGREHPELLKVKPSHGHSDTIINGISRIGYMSGGHAARWHDEEMADVLTHKAVEFIERSRQRPFFLYFATHDIHVPRVPNARFVGKSAHGTRGDAILEFDDSVGEVLAALDRLKLADHTLVIVTSDNGGVLDDGYQDGSAQDPGGHRCNGPLRGFKGGLFEGGHRIPFVARWKGHVPVGVSDQLICHVDLLAACADLLGRPLAPGSGLDSLDVLPALLGGSRPIRRNLVHHTGGFPGRLAIRSGDWKLIPVTRPSETGRPGRGPLLFNLARDLGEARDESREHPEKVRELASLLESLRVVSALPGQPQRKKVIEFGADEPNTAFMRANVDRMERLPFDGFVYHLSGANFTWEMWGARRFTLAEFQKSIDDLRATKFRRLTDRFLRVNVTPGEVDWFDDDAWNIVLDNVALAAQVAKAGGSKGFLFDTEQYQGSPFCYNEQRHKDKKSFADYQAKVRERGEQWMRTVNGRFSDITILLTFGYEITRPRKNQKDRSQLDYGLLADFLDGALAVCSNETRIVDAWEMSYGFKRREDFQRAYDATKINGPEKWTTEPEKYRRHLQVGFGICLDNDWDVHRWQEKDISKNYFTPDSFEASARAALGVSDEYVWIYSGQPRWWTNEKLPRAYLEALERARKPQKSP